jgi:hypothetical protein
MTTDAKDLGFIVGLLHAIAASHEGDVMLVGNVRAEQIVEICKHIATLTRERDALRKDAALLDALQSEHERFDPVAALVVKVKHDRNSSDWANVAGDVRAALAAALIGIKP